MIPENINEEIGPVSINDKPAKNIVQVLFGRKSTFLNILITVIVPAVVLICLEWVARGTLENNDYGTGFWQLLATKFPGFFLGYLLLLFLYVFISQSVGFHFVAVLIVSVFGIVPASVTYYKLALRGEPLLPWDLFQIKDMMGISSSLQLEIPVSIWACIGIVVLMTLFGVYVKIPHRKTGKKGIIIRMVSAATALCCLVALFMGVFLSKDVSTKLGIVEDPWMQDRYYRTHGLITGFMTNLRMLDIEVPQNYSGDAALDIAEEITEQPPGAFYENSYAASGGELSQDPDIIFLMAESFWDVRVLEGISYDQPVMANYDALMQEGAYGTAFTPSFGGGTCDVEFEALTGFSMEMLPAGSKPYQQYMSSDMFSLPQYLKSTKDYQTMAIHGYGEKFWNRIEAYPKLGIDEFISSEDFVDPELRRGFISDNAMVDRIIEEIEKGEDNGPMFIHAVTMQNHTTYDPLNYPEDELVRVTEYPDTISESTIGQLEDCATGIREMDAALGKLTDYLRTRERPTIVVFWGDHMNPMNDGHTLFENTGYIEPGDINSPKLRETPMLIWSNFDDSSVDLGTLSTYQISPTMMNLYGLETPVMFDFLISTLPEIRGRTRGNTINPDGSYTDTMTEEQAQMINEHYILQYDYMFGDKVLENYAPDEDEE